LADQDVSGDVQTHLGAAQTQILCLIIHFWAWKKAFALLFMKMIHNFVNALKLHAA
jgi:hypothetical protein